jgi:hypothetical protein
MEQHKYILLNTLGQAFILEADMPRDVHAPIERVEEDLLGRSVLAERIYTRLCSDDCPQAIGIYGGWGTGKTSLLNLIQMQNQVSDSKCTKQIHIEMLDAWQYEATGNLLVPVIVRLKRISGDENFLPKSWKASMRRVLAVTTLSLAGLALSRSPVQIGDIQSIWENIEKIDKEDPASILLGWEKMTDSIHDTREAFEEVVRVVLQEQKCDCLVLCIDNLDRCIPDRVVNLLESIKNFFAVPNCIWVFAMDSGVVASYINRKYEGTTMDGNSYLDKIIPEQYHLSFYPEENDPCIYDLIRVATGRDLTLNEWRRLPLIPQVMVPRRLKKSAVKFSECFSGKNPPDANRDTVFLISLLYHTWPDFYERLASNSDEHIGRLLANFFKVTTSDGSKWGEYHPLPLDGKFSEEQDLILFLQTAFPNATKYSHDVVRDIRRAMLALRQVGLP